MATGLKAVILREIDRISSEKIYLWILLILPAFTFVLFPTMFSEGKAENYSVAVYDADNTPLSRKVISWIEATPEVNFTNKVYSLQEGKRLIEKGDVYAVLKIPKGLEKGVFLGTPKKIILFHSNLNLSAGSGVSVATMKAVGTLSAGINMQKRIAADGEMYNQAHNNVQPIKLDIHTLYNPYINYSYFLVTAILPVMLLMFILSMTIYIIGTEIKYSTSEEWYKISGDSVIVALTGKLLPYTVIFITEAFIMNTIIFKAIGSPLNGNPVVLFFATTIFILAYQAMGVLLIVILPNMRLALSMGAAYASLALSFAGLTFPIFAMNGFMQGFAQIFPYTHYLEILLNESMKGLDVYYSINQFLIMFFFIMLPFLFFPRIKAIMLKEQYWGKS